MHKLIKQKNNLKIYEVTGIRGGNDFTLYLFYSVETFDKRVLEIFRTLAGAKNFCKNTRDFVHK